MAVVGFVGLGRMGKEAVRNLLEKGHQVVGYNRTPDATESMLSEGVVGTYSLKELTEKLVPPRLIWLMVPAGPAVDDVLFGEAGLLNYIESGDLVIDGGNSFYRDSMRRADQLKQHEIFYLDCGSSGGMEGARQGMCLMIGGEEEAFRLAEPVFRSLACSDGYSHVGPSGSGHFVKMVHNAIEYGMLEALGEGFELLKEGPFSVDLAQVAGLWTKGSVVRGWLMELAERAFDQDAQLETITGRVGGGDTGNWAIEEAWKAGVPFPTIALSYAMRHRSRQEDTFAGKVVAALRHEFGGHEVIVKADE